MPTIERSDGVTAAVDLSAAETALGIPFEIPVHLLDGIKAPDVPTDYVTLACFCPDPFGICFDLNAMQDYGADPNVALLHECVHVWQWLREVTAGDGVDPDRWATMINAGLVAGYDRAPHELEADVIARGLDAAGVRVFFPSPELAAELHAADIGGYGPRDVGRRTHQRAD